MRVLLLAAFMAVSACGTMGNINGPEKLAPAVAGDNTGVVVFSTGALRSCVSTSTFLKIMKGGAEYRSAEKRLFNVDGAFVKSDFPGQTGFVHAFRLPAGEYYFTPWIANPYVVPTQAPRWNFSVAAGEAVYLGEYYLEASCSLSTWANFRNQWDRDQTVVARKNPKIDLTTVAHRIATLSGYAVGGSN